LTARTGKPLLGLGALGAACLAYAALVERRWYALRHVTVPVLRPAARRPLRMLHLSDLHLLPRQEHMHSFVRDLLAHRPDLVVATGDLVGHPDSIDDVIGLLGGVGDRPALLVLGSNDFYGPAPKNPLRYFAPGARKVFGERLDSRRLIEGLEAAGWGVFDNRRATIDTPAGPVDVAGLGDPHIRHDRAERVDWSPPADEVALRLGLVHAPYVGALDQFDRHGFDLVMAGHTHGGQLRLPGVGALVTNCDLPLGQARGLSRHGVGLWLHVSAGLGHSRYAPVRFACRPEATLLDLVPAPAGR
jgi:predicted MPP superfamily phosphohydrolase